MNVDHNALRVITNRTSMRGGDNRIAAVAWAWELEAHIESRADTRPEVERTRRSFTDR